MIRITLSLLLVAVLAAGDDPFEDERRAMVENQLQARDIVHQPTLEAMQSVPRHEFVTSDYRHRAYDDNALPIGHGQTISQPYIVAYMTQLLDPQPDDVMLEVGTGSGYHAAVLGELVDRMYTIEIIEELAEFGASNLHENGYDNVQVMNADGYHGWEEHAPFDGIVVTAAIDHIPPPLVDQLKEDGKMVIPVGSPFRTQTLMLVEKEDGDVRTENLMPVRFVPFTRDEDQDE